MSDLSAIIREYYARIDAGDVTWVLNMFSKDGVYDRAGQAFHGREAIQSFYMNERKVKLHHSKLDLWQCGPDIFVEGAFSGVGADGSKRAGQFADHWTFNDAGKVILRRTSLFTGSTYIKE